MNDDELRIRRASEKDAPALLALYHAAYSVHNDPNRPPAAALKDTLDDVLDYVRHQEVLVAEDPSGRIVATVAIKPIANVRRLAVAPEAKGAGLGAAMLDAAVARARDRGYESAMLDTFEGHPWLAEFYRRHGFVDRSVESFPDGSVWRQFRMRLVRDRGAPDRRDQTDSQMETPPR